METSSFRKFIFLVIFLTGTFGILSALQGYWGSFMVWTISSFSLMTLWFLNHTPLLQIHRLWIKMTYWLQKITTVIVLLFFYYLGIYPISLFSRLLGKKWLSLEGYWIERPSKDKEQACYEWIF